MPQKTVTSLLTTESYDVTDAARLYSRPVAKRTARIERRGGRASWDGQRIREIREALRISREQLSEAAHVSVDDIGRHERNDPKSNPSVDVLARLSLGLNVPIATLLEPVGAPIPVPEKATAGRVQERPGEGSAILERLLERLDQDAPADNSIKGDILRAQHALASAQAALNRALRRADEKSGAA